MKDPIKTYDARWEVSEFDDKEVLRLFEATFGYARFIGVDTLVFARDARLGCARVMEIGLEAAYKAGFRVYACFDPVSTPLSYFIAMQTGLIHPNTMGLSITASHNPKQYIGIKFTVPGVEAIGYDCGPLGGLTKVKQLYHDRSYIQEVRPGGSLESITHPAKDYMDYTMQLAGVNKGDLKGIKVVLDLPLRLVPNGDFPTGSPNPTSQNKMNPAIALAQKSNADVVLGIDGDGDRIVFGDQTGVFSAGFVMIPILRAILSKETGSSKPKILYDPKVNPLALSKWAEMDTEPVLFRNGHSQIKGHLKEIGALAGAEESGHFYHQLPLKNLLVAGENSLFTILLFLKSLLEDNSIIQQVREMQDLIYTSGEFNYYFPDDRIRDQALAAVLSFFGNEKAELTTKSETDIELEGTVIYRGVNRKEGTFQLEKSWYAAYVRTATNEKGIVRCYISSSDSRYGEQIRAEVIKILKLEFNGSEIE